MCPTAQPDGHDTPGLIDEAVPGEAALVEDVGVGFEDAVRQPVVAHGLPDILNRPFDFAQESVELGAFRGQRQQGDVGWDDERTGAMPPRLIEEQDGVSARRDSGGYLRHPASSPP